MGNWILNLYDKPNKKLYPKLPKFVRIVFCKVLLLLITCITLSRKVMAYNMPVRLGCGSVAFYPVEPDHLDTDPPENTIKKVNDKGEIY